ncbi:universal stress protein [Halorientalis pallida]|uniref:Universal stress protein n=1 Tax=Halorientalis pallida TaxID=2479928 RepID=A0A498L1B7_9EURY|nr:universal stress protein [Halorientalis pallida]RXK49141.1 universal stress protein [Halorientalis pallida]
MTDDQPDTAGDLAIREPPRVLVPIEVLEGQTIPQSLVAFLAPAELILLGYHVIPEQTPTEQASMQFEDRVRAAVDDIAASFAEAHSDVEERVAFTHDREQTLDRVADEIDATAVLLPNPTGEIDDILVPLRDVVDVDRLADLVSTLVDGEDKRVTLWDLTGDENTALLDQSEQTLRDRGLADEQIRTESDDVEFPTRAIVDRSDDFDVIVMGEGEQTLLTTVLGDTSERIADGAVAPVLVVRRERSEDGDDEDS